MSNTSRNLGISFLFSKKHAYRNDGHGVSVRKTVMASVFLSATLLTVPSAFAAPAANALPTNGQVVAGQANISQTGNVMNINQSTQRAVINWDSFNVGKNATVNFNQPNSGASTLNRVNGASQSMINGAVNANGQVIFVNPNGVVFGKGAEVNTGGLVATTMNIKDSDYMSGKMSFSGGESGKVINKGTITANGVNGYIALMAPEVKNQGVLIANISNSNTIALVSGTKVTLSFDGSQLTNITVDASAINSLISNKHAIITNGGQVIIAANAASNLKASVINNTGTINADSITTAGGKVFLTAGTVNQNGTVSANSQDANGGNVTISGNEVNLNAASKTTATGATSGGQILIGKTNANTAQSQLNASVVNVNQVAIVDASATQNGSGGSISIWSQIATNVAGILKATGGAISGNGGNIDTSSAGTVKYGSSLVVDTTAPHGQTGHWTTDPLSITIDSNAATVLSNALNTTNVILDATAISCGGIGSCSQSSSPMITFFADVYSANALTSLTLNAQGGTINVNSNVTAGSVYAVAQAININGSINTNGGSNSNIYLAGAIINILGNINSNGNSSNNTNSNTLNLANTITANNRRNSINGQNGLTANTNTYTSNGGAINIIATGDINIGSISNATSYISANGQNGGSINIVSVNGNINNYGVIDAVGKNNLGGAITLAAQNTNTFTDALISADGYIQGGVIQLGVVNGVGSGSTLAPPSINSQVATLLAAVNFTPSNTSNILSSNTSLDNTTVITANAANSSSQVVLNSQAGQIYIAGNNSLNTAASIAANADSGGLIILSSPAGTYQNTGYVQTNGGAGLGGTIAQSGLISTTLIGATLEANGTLGGGNIITGRDFQANPLPGSAAQDALLPNLSAVITVPTSQLTTVDANSTTTANTLTSGNGGNVLVWGDSNAVAGTMSAQAFGVASNGGFIETSGQTLMVASSASVKAGSVRGNAGTWLLDPYNLLVASSGGDVTGATISAALATTGVTLTAGAASVSGSGVTLTGSGASSGLGNIYIYDTISWSTPQSLTLKAYNNIYVGSPSVGGSITLSGSTGSQALTMTACGGVSACYSSGTASSGTGYVLMGMSSSPTTSLLTNQNGFNGQINISNNSAVITVNGLSYTIINSVSGITSATNNLSNYVFGSDVDLLNTLYNAAPFLGTQNFEGVMNGFGHVVKNLNISVTGSAPYGGYGLFRSIYNGNGAGNLYNIGVTGSISGSGSLSGQSGNGIGGLVGYSYGGNISNAYSTVSIAYTVGSSNSVGGLVGALISGYASSVNNSYATGAINASSSLSVGGLIGDFSGVDVLSNSFATGAVTGLSSVGGLIGNLGASGLVSNVYSTGTVTASQSSSITGGLIGNGSGTASISNAYAYGQVVCTGYAGNCGGFAGYISSASITNSYWNSTVNPSVNSNGLSFNSSSAAALGLTSLSATQMASASSFSSGFGNTSGSFTNASGWGYNGTLQSPPILCAIQTCTSYINSLITDTYQGVNGGNWSTNSNWSLNLAPLSSNASSYSNIVISGGLTVLLDAATVGNLSAPITNGGTISFTGSGNVTLSGIISGTGAINTASTYTGIATLSSTNTYSGGTTINGGTLSVGSDANLGGSSGTLNLNGGTLKVSTSTAFTSARTINLLASSTINNADSSGITFTGNVTGPSSTGTPVTLTLTGANPTTFSAGVISNGTGTSTVALVQNTTGTTTLSGTNIYTGGTTISAGTLKAASASALSTGLVSIGSAGTLDLSYSGTVTLGSLSMSSAAAITNSANTSNLVVSGTSTLAGSINTAGNQTYTGAVTLGGNTSLTTLNTSSANTNGNITFSSTVDSSVGISTGNYYGLSISNGTGTTAFGGVVGGNSTNSALGYLCINASGCNGSAVGVVANIGTTTLAGNVTTSGNQTYGGNLTLGANTVLTSTANSSNAAVKIAGMVNSSTTSASINLEFLGGGAWELGTNCGISCTWSGPYIASSSSNGSGGSSNLSITYNTTAATAIVSGTPYIITSVGNTNWTSFGASSNVVGVTFTATTSGTVNSGTGTASSGYSYTLGSSTAITYLVVGGGGAGGSDGGGGAGAVFNGSTTLSNGTYNIVVGPGGLPNTSRGGTGYSGSNTYAFGIIAGGGGGGGGEGNSGSPGVYGASGGGEGAGAGNNNNGTGSSSTQTPTGSSSSITVTGYRGGLTLQSGGYVGGGGGGANAVGTAGVSGQSGSGGNGVLVTNIITSLSGSSTGQTGNYFGGGGGGGYYFGTTNTTQASGGLGGGGLGGTNPTDGSSSQIIAPSNALSPTSGTANSGGGGGGTSGWSGWNGTSFANYVGGGAGGSGIVAISGNLINNQNTYALTINSGTGAATIGGSVSNITTLAINSKSASSSIAGAIGGSTALKLNTGTVATVGADYTGANSSSAVLNLAGNNTYSGGTTISGGTLQAGSATAFGASAGAITVSNGAALDLNGQTLTNSNALTLNGTGINSGGALTNSSTNPGTYVGGVTLASASLIGSTTGAITVSGAIASSANAYNLALVGNQAITLSSATNTLSTIASGSSLGALSISNNQTMTIGSMTIGGTNYSGLSSTGIILIKTLSGNLNINNSVTTTSTSSNTLAPAILLSAGYNDATTNTSDNIVLGSSSSSLITAGNGAIIALYSGAPSASTNLTTFTGAQSVNYFNYGATTSSLPSSGLGYYAIYRGTQPTLYVIFGASNTPTYGSAPTITYTFNTLANGTGTSYLSTDTATVNATGTALFKGTYATTSTSNVSLNSSANAGSYSNVTYLSGLSSPIYAFSAGSTAGTLTINKANAYIGLSNNIQSSTYGASPSFSYTVYSNQAGTTALTTTNPTGSVTFADITLGITTNLNSSANAGAYNNVSYTGGLTSTNYNFAAINSVATYTVNQAQAYVIITPSQSNVYGAAPTINYTFNANSAGTGSTISGSPTGLSGTAVITNTPTSSSNVGTYNLTYASGLSSTNYVFNPAASSVPYTVNQAPLNIVISKTYDGNSAFSNINPYTLSGTTYNGDSLPTIASGSATVSSPNASASPYTSFTTNSLVLSNPNYTITGGTVAATINPKTITYTTAGATSTYGTLATLSTPVFSGLIGSDNPGASITLYSNTTPVTLSATTNAGTYAQQVAISNSNYQLATTGNTIGNLVISPATLAIAGANNNVTYNGLTQTNSGATLSVNGGAASVINGTTVSTGIGAQTFTLIGYASGLNAGSTPISDNFSISPNAASGAIAGNYNISYTNGSLTIGKANLSVTGTQAYNGTATIAGSSLTISGVAGQTFTGSGTADLTTKNVQTNQPLADVNGLVLTPNGNFLVSNYNPINVSNTSISITPLAVMLTAPSITKVYDGGYTYNMTAANLAAMSSQLVGGDTVSAASVVFTGNNPNVGTNKSVSLNSAIISDGNGGANYTVTLANSNTSQVMPASLTITANNASKFVTQSDTAGFNGVVYSGFANGETASSALSGTLTVTRSNASTNSAGSYTGVLVPGGLTANNGNYTITPVAGNFTIVPANELLVQVSPVTSIYGVAPTYTATAQYLSCSVSGCPSSGSVNTVHTLSPVITNNAFSVSDGSGGAASFTIIPLAASTSGSGNTNVGGYQLSASNISNSSNNFSNTIVLTGALTVSPLTISANQLGVSGISKVYNGSTAISGLSLNTTAANSSIKNGDAVTITGTGTYADANVGNNKSVTVSVGLTGNDAGNYILSSNQLTANIGTITQLSSVTYTGASGGNWSNSSNWAGGAIPTLGNVATVVIPNGKTVVYDTANLTNLTPISAITDNGAISFNSALPTIFGNNVSGSGAISQSGAGALTLTGNNSYSGGTSVASGSTLTVGSNSALGTGAVTSSGGLLNVVSGIVLPSLTVNGSVTVTSDIATTGNQVYNGAVTIDNSSDTTTLSSSSGNINFGSTIKAGAANQSLVLSAAAGQVSFNDQVGVAAQTYNSSTQTYSPTSYSGYQSQASNNLTNLVVSANTINLNADISTLGTQTYTGSMIVGDNGSNGPTRLLLSEDPAIVFNGTINDTAKGTHNLYVRAVTTQGQAPTITFNGVVGGIAALESLAVSTGSQDTGSGALYSAIDNNPAHYLGTVTIKDNISTTGDQTYTANNYVLGDGSSNQTLALSTKTGNITFNVGTSSGAGFTPAGSGLFLDIFNGGGTVFGLSGSGLNYGITDPAATASASSAVNNTNLSANAGVLQNIANNQLNLLASDDALDGLSGTVTVGAPSQACEMRYESNYLSCVE
ncbi:filamentous hemagglutinin N-terminal domain-containing protein [Polynucleobacter paneuropaeus]|nr:filamentous hemagglutinin N-terminal domain-containing protein [Polynucleobacter paneuropaeus]